MMDTVGVRNSAHTCVATWLGAKPTVGETVGKGTRMTGAASDRVAAHGARGLSCSGVLRMVWRGENNSSAPVLIIPRFFQKSSMSIYLIPLRGVSVNH